MKRILVLLVVLALAGGGYWFMQNRERFFPQPEAVQVAPQRWQVSTAQPTETRNATLAPANATNATIQANATEGGNATQGPVPADEIVRHDFVQDLSSYLVARYLPGGTKRNPAPLGRFDLNVKSVNIRYGVDFPGLSVDPADTLGARKAVFAHVLQTPVLEFLHAAYTPLFLDSLEQALQSATYTLPTGQTAAINDQQRTEMLNLLANRLKGIGQTVATLARNESIRGLVAKYLQDMDNVSQAHLAFWNLQTENASVAAMGEASARIKTTIQTREISRQRLLQAIVSSAGPQGMDASELVYLAQWVYRRGQDSPQAMAAVAKAGELLARTADAVEERSRQPRPGLEPDAAGNATGVKME
jgi:hypothetical protein